MNNPIYLNKAGLNRDDKKPMGLLADREYNHIFAEEINVLGPALHPHVPLLLHAHVPIQILPLGVLPGGGSGDPLVEVRAKYKTKIAKKCNTIFIAIELCG